MPLPIADALPTACLTNNMNPVARKKLKEEYRKAKVYRIQAAWAVVTGSGVLELAKDLATLILVRCTNVVSMIKLLGFIDARMTLEKFL
jgi:hypothetical protein